MNETLLAVALSVAAVVGVAAGGVAALDVSAPGADAQHDGDSTVDGYAFEPVDHDDWLADRDADASTVAELLLTGEAGDAIREQFDAGEPLAMDVYGSLQSDTDSAHVVVTPAPGVTESTAADQEPRVEATVDLGAGAATLVGVSTPSDDEAAVRNASEVDASADLATENATGSEFTVAVSDGGTVLSAADATTFTLDEENVTLVDATSGPDGS